VEGHRTSTAAGNVGTARQFAVVTYPAPGLLVLGEIDYADGWGDRILADIDSILRQRWLPAVWGFSIGGLTAEGKVLIEEVSLTRNPAHPDARVLAIGADALSTWELLSEAPRSGASDRAGNG
jgi:hypothetical protein